MSAEVGTDITLTWDVQSFDPTNDITFDVFFGTNSVLSQANLQGTTTTNQWPLQGLNPMTTYYWQIVAKLNSVKVIGPVWQFTTVGLDHFALSEIPSPQLVGTPIPLTVSARDDQNRVVTGYRGSAQLSAWVPTETASTIVITEVDTSPADRIEFVNVSEKEINVSGWEVDMYDWNSWPAAKVRFTMPGGSISLPGDVFQLRRFLPQAVPGTYPNFFFGDDLYWNNNSSGNPVTVLLRDNTGSIVDFVCAVDADARQITDPVSIPAAQWSGAPISPNGDSHYTYQRVGLIDQNSASDWIVATNSMGKTNTGLTVPFVNYLPLAVTPTLLTAFSNGVWTGAVSFQDTTARAFLRVDDGHGHLGTGNEFMLSAPNDVSLDVALSTTRATVAKPFSYLLTVTNTGPSDATGLWLTNFLPDTVTFEDATASQGTITHDTDMVVCDLGTLSGGTTASITITVTPAARGTLTNLATLIRAETEAYPSNNTVLTTTPVSLPLLTILDAGIAEGQSGVTNLVIPVLLSDPVQQPVTVDYATADGMAEAGSDYESQSGTIQFPPGTTNASITVPVFGDRLYESNETFSVILSQPSNAMLASSFATGTITNDDYQPGMTITDATVVEGDDGVSNAVFNISINAVSGRPATVTCFTVDGSAVARLDYAPVSQPIIFWPGDTNRAISVPIFGNMLIQSNRTFGLKLAYPVGAYFVRNQGTGTIQDDDAWRFDHFAWSAVPPRSTCTNRSRLP